MNSAASGVGGEYQWRNGSNVEGSIGVGEMAKGVNHNYDEVGVGGVQGTARLRLTNDGDVTEVRNRRIV